MSTNKGLGKGLSVLFGEETDEKKPSLLIKINNIEPNPNQPRKDFDEEGLAELCESIKKNGVITPIAVRKTEDTYQIIAGERRWRASRLAGLSEIPAIVLDVDEKQAYGLALIENLQRENLNPIEEAEGFKRLIDEYGMSQEEASETVGRSRSAVANSLRLLNLPDEIKKSVSDGELSSGHARAVLSVRGEAQQIKAAQKMIECGMSVREAESFAKKINQSMEEKPKPDDKNRIYIEDLERRLSQSVGHKVSIVSGRKKGRLIIEYYGNDELDELCVMIEKGKR